MLCMLPAHCSNIPESTLLKWCCINIRYWYAISCLLESEVDPPPRVLDEDFFDQAVVHTLALGDGESHDTRQPRDDSSRAGANYHVENLMGLPPAKRLLRPTNGSTDQPAIRSNDHPNDTPFERTTDRPFDRCGNSRRSTNEKKPTTAEDEKEKKN